MAKTNYESVVILTPVLSERMLQDAAKLIREADYRKWWRAHPQRKLGAN